MSLIIDTIQSFLPPKHKRTPSGWISFNAVCCVHNGNSQDTRHRGGIIITEESVSYHCFNCGFKATWQIGWTLGPKLKKLLHWLHVPDDLISKCAFDALRTREDIESDPIKSLIPVFTDRKMPLGSEPLSKWVEDNPPEDLLPVLEYLADRGFYIDDYNWHWTDESGFQNRLIIPFMHKNRLVGYTARKVTDGKPKYISEQQPGYVFNLDRQTPDRKYVFVCEGPIDAISIDAVAVMSNEVGPAQKILIEQLQKQVVVVPDRDEPGKKLVEQAIAFNWGVSFPEWPDDIKDINDAIRKQGRLYTLWNIVKNTHTNALKIQLLERNWFKRETNE